MSSGHKFATVSNGGIHTCGVTTQGEGYCWGSGIFGQLGSGTAGQFYHEATPEPVSGKLVLSSVSARLGHTCGVTTQGEAYCWGSGSRGQLGNGSDGEAYLETEPMLVSGRHAFTSVSSGWDYTCGITTLEEAYCWGFGGNGQLGTGSDGTGYYETEPVLMSGGYIFISADRNHTCGITVQRQAKCWGSGSGGALGNGSIEDQPRPVSVDSGENFAAVSAGWDHTCGVTVQGNAYCWGSSRNGQLGNGFDGPDHTETVPGLVSGQQTFTSVSGSRDHTCGVTTPGQVYCWGRGSEGQLGNGSTENQLVPVPITAGQ